MSLIKENKHTILARPIFNWFSQGEFVWEELRIFAEQYYILSEGFREFLAISLVNVTDEVARRTVVSNLWDEYGRGKVERFHRVMLMTFMKACGLSEPSNYRPVPTTRIYVSGMKALCQSPDVGEILGAIGPGCEDITTAEYEIIYSGLRKSRLFNDEDLAFFEDHIRHDQSHSDGISEAIARWTDSNGSTSVESGMNQALILEGIFWDGIWDHIVGHRTSMGEAAKFARPPRG